MALPGKPTAAQERRNREAQRMGWVYATAISFAGAVAVFTVLGYALDRWLGTRPWMLIGGLVFGLVGGTIKFVRDGLRVNTQSAAEIAGKHDWRPVPPPPEPDEDAEVDAGDAPGRSPPGP